jgi:hypothetical protein
MFYFLSHLSEEEVSVSNSIVAQTQGFKFVKLRECCQWLKIIVIQHQNLQIWECFKASAITIMREKMIKIHVDKELYCVYSRLLKERSISWMEDALFWEAAIISWLSKTFLISFFLSTILLLEFIFNIYNYIGWT